LLLFSSLLKIVASSLKKSAISLKKKYGLSILWRLYASVIAAVLTPDPARKTKPTDRRKLWQGHNFCAL